MKFEIEYAQFTKVAIEAESEEELMILRQRWMARI